MVGSEADGVGEVPLLLIAVIATTRPFLTSYPHHPSQLKLTQGLLIQVFSDSLCGSKMPTVSIYSGLKCF